ncbi:MAG TPA: hypothetical protein VH000_03120 [Rhizomicrobium sp.]|nr:hypothetical protein [Rhizomicrobium sp.]
MTGDIKPFLSTVAGTLDGKGRVCVPAPYREILSAQNTPGVYVLPSFSAPVLEAFGEDVLQAFHRKQAALDPFFSPEHDDKVFAVISMTKLLARDENGRVVLPAEFIAHAGLKERITFVGMGTKFQIWDSERFAAYQAERLKRAAALREGGAA